MIQVKEEHLTALIAGEGAANPESLRDPAFIAYLGSSIPEPFSHHELDSLVVRSRDHSARGTTEDSIRYFTDIFSRDGSLLLLAMNTDTAFIYPFVDTNSTDVQIDSTSLYLYRDSTVSILNTIGDLRGQFQLAAFYYNKGDLTNANTVIMNIPGSYYLTGDLVTEYANYITIWNSLDSLAAHNKGLLEMDSTSRALIDTMADGQSLMFTKVLASNIVDAMSIMSGKASDIPITRMKLPCPYFLPDDFAFSSPTAAKHKIQTNTVNVYPNPAKERVMFDYSLPVTDGDVILEVTDIVGRGVLRFKIDDKQGIINWDTENVPSGVYLYKIKDASNIISVGKVSVIK